MKKALIVWGGWEGHEPKQCAELTADMLRGEDFEVELADDLAVYADQYKLKEQNLIVPMWTCGQISQEQFECLEEAVREGAGLGGFHGGMGDAFHDCQSYQFMVGGQFVAHPDGIKEYTVNIQKPDDPIVSGIGDFKVRSEQYYMLIDPSIETLATTRFEAPREMPWVKDCVMPVVWKRMWGAGRVFYSSLGHVAHEFQAYPEMREITRRGLLWASR